MIYYGAIKVLGFQMPEPSLTRLLQTYGSSSPMGLLWTFIGDSKGFQFFIGFIEIVSGLLVIFPWTSLLGALLCLASTVMIFAFNIFYDVPVKLYSLYLIINSIFLLAPEFKNLFNFFILNNEIGPRKDTPLFQNKWLQRGVQILQLCFATYVLYIALYLQATSRFKEVSKSPYYGIWNVDKFVKNKTELPPLMTDKDRWFKLIVEKDNLLVVQKMDLTNEYYNFWLEDENKTLVLETKGSSKQTFTFSIVQTDPGNFSIEGKFNELDINAKLSEFKLADMKLINSKFRWIQEAPNNR